MDSACITPDLLQQQSPSGLVTTSLLSPTSETLRLRAWLSWLLLLPTVCWWLHHVTAEQSRLKHVRASRSLNEFPVAFSLTSEKLATSQPWHLLPVAAGALRRQPGHPSALLPTKAHSPPDTEQIPRTRSCSRWIDTVAITGFHKPSHYLNWA